MATEEEEQFITKNMMRLFLAFMFLGPLITVYFQGIPWKYLLVYEAGSIIWFVTKAYDYIIGWNHYRPTADYWERVTPIQEESIRYSMGIALTALLVYGITHVFKLETSEKEVVLWTAGLSSVNALAKILRMIKLRR